MSSTTASVHDSPAHSRENYEPINETRPLLERSRDDEQPEGQSSIVTIFAIWNMMMGTSLLSMPWAYAHAGLLGGLLAIAVMGVVCFYTASLMLTIPAALRIELQEYSDLVRLLLGPFYAKLSQLSSVTVLGGGCIVYWILMNNFIINIASLAYDVGWRNGSISTNASGVVCHNDFQALHLQDAGQSSQPAGEYSAEQLIRNLVPVVLVLVQGPLICLRSVSVFLKFNFVGTFSVFFLLAFALFKSLAWGGVNLTVWDASSPHYAPLLSLNLPVYTGVLTLALFIHNCLTTIMRTQAQPQHNYRDLAVAYVLVVVTYLFLGVSIFVSFPLRKDCLRDNLLDNLESNDVYALAARAFLLVQIFTLFPLLCYIVRVQVFQLLPRSGSELWRIVGLNTVLLGTCNLFGFFYPQIGAVIRYCGSFSGLVLTFTLPPLMLIHSRRKLERPLHWAAVAVLYFIMLMGVWNFAAQFLVNA